ncbi:MAG: bifunctional adenosylcobinamide kinase/adenosylcobinamide-phosphate guanylyltransferase [Candidatus Manganitrophaceae bacterium]
MKGRTTLILGGARSGKSRFALQLGNETGERSFPSPRRGGAPPQKVVRLFGDPGRGEVQARKVFLATASPVDPEMKERIARHQHDRGPSWDTVEAFFDLDREIVKIDGRYDVVLVDCLTLWLSNWIMNDSAEETIREKIAGLKEAVQKSTSTVLLVSNEVGMGVVPPTPMGRAFRDLQGILNQEMAAVVDEVYFVTAGIPLRMK